MFSKIVKFIVLVLFMSLFYSCSTNNSDGKTEIVFWHSFVPSTFPALEELIKDFENENPYLKIKAQYVPTGDALIQKLVTAVQSNTAPDISWIHSDFLDKLVQANAIYPISYFIKNDSSFKKEIDDIFQPLLQSASWNEVLYAIPMEATLLALMYNKDLFIKAGLNQNHPPANWNELYSIAKKLTTDKNKDGKIDQYGFYVPVFPASGQLSIWMVLQWSPFLWQAGGKEINEDQTKVLFNSPAGASALAFWKKMYNDFGLTNFTLTHDQGFFSQTFAMVLDGPWNLPLYRKIKNFEWGVAPLPAGPVKSATYLAGEHLVIFKQSKNPDKAWQFIKYIIRPDVQSKFSINSGYLPVRKAVLDLKEFQDFLEKDEAMKSFVFQLDIGQARARIDHHRVEINQSIAAAVEKSIIGNVDPQTALNEAASISNKYLQKAHSNN